MSFRDTLDRHLQAIQEKDLQGLADTLAPDELVLITSDGRLARSTKEFLELHRGWFAMAHWKLAVTPAKIYEGADMGVAVLHLDYRETPPGRPPVHQESYLTLVFQRRGERWLMVQDQNTPIRAA